MFQCEVCSKTYSRKSDLTKHRRSTHYDYEEETELFKSSNEADSLFFSLKKLFDKQKLRNEYLETTVMNLLQQNKQLASVNDQLIIEINKIKSNDRTTTKENKNGKTNEIDETNSNAPSQETTLVTKEELFKEPDIKQAKLMTNSNPSNDPNTSQEICEFKPEHSQKTHFKHIFGLAGQGKLPNLSSIFTLEDDASKKVKPTADNITINNTASNEQGQFILQPNNNGSFKVNNTCEKLDSISNIVDNCRPNIIDKCQSSVPIYNAKKKSNNLKRKLPDPQVNVEGQDKYLFQFANSVVNKSLPFNCPLKKFYCDICDKSYTCKYRLDKHKRTFHTAEEQLNKSAAFRNVAPRNILPKPATAQFGTFSSPTTVTVAKDIY